MKRLVFAVCALLGGVVLGLWAALGTSAADTRPLVNQPAEDMILLPPGSMLERIDSLHIFRAGARGEPIGRWPNEPGDTVRLDADIFWTEGKEPSVWARVWNLTACVQGDEAECRRQWEYMDLDPYTGTLRILRSMPDPERLSVSLGIAVGSRSVPPGVT